MDDVISRKLLAKLRDVAPHSVRVYDSSDDHRDVAVPTRRKRWSQVIETIDARSWTRVEMLDKSKSILGYVDNESPEAPALEDISGASGGLSAAAAQSRWFLEMMIRAQTVALQYRDKEHTTLLGAVREVLEVQMQGTREMISLMRAQREEAMDLAQIRAAAESGDSMDQVVKLIEASPKLMSFLGPLLMSLRSPQRIAAPAPACPAGSRLATAPAR